MGGGGGSEKGVSILEKNMGIDSNITDIIIRSLIYSKNSAGPRMDP